MLKRIPALVAAAVLLLAIGKASPAGAQETLERSTILSGGWVGYPGVFYANLPYRFTTLDDTDIIGRATFDFSLGLPQHALVGARFAHESPTVPGRPTEWEAFGRYQALGQMRGAALDLAVQAGYNTAAESFDGELSAARWLGPVRLLGAARAMSSPYGQEDARVALAAGAVVHPLPGAAPVALSADVATPLDLQENEQVGWSVGLDLGVSFTTHTLSLFVTNTPRSTLEGLSRGIDQVYVGFELTIPIVAGRFTGWYPSREEAMEAVVEEPGEVEQVVHAEARRYLFSPKRIEIAPGTTVEWTNTDDVVHTVTAEDGSWDSGGIPPGESWQARFDEPGTYPFYCGPHPFMKGVVIVR